MIRHPNPEPDLDYTELRERLRRAVLAVRPGWLASEVDDLIQLAMIRILNLARKSEEEQRFNASYLKKVAYSVLVDSIRRKRRRPEVSLLEESDESPAAEPASANPGPESSTEAREIRDGIRHCLLTLSDHRRRAVTLHLQGHTVKEVAKVMSWDEKRAENLVFRGLGNLRDCLRKKGLEP